MKRGKGAVIEVARKPGFDDGEGKALRTDLRELGLDVVAVDTAKLYRFEGYASTGIRRAAQELLTDQVTETWSLQGPGKRASAGEKGWALEIWLKPGVTDPVAESVRRGLKGLRLPEPKGLRVGLAYRIKGRLDKKALETSALRTVVNPVIHQWHLRKLSN